MSGSHNVGRGRPELALDEVVGNADAGQAMAIRVRAFCAEFNRYIITGSRIPLPADIRAQSPLQPSALNHGRAGASKSSFGSAKRMRVGAVRRTRLPDLIVTVTR
jgi:hypothetical protein